MPESIRAGDIKRWVPAVNERAAELVAKGWSSRLLNAPPLLQEARFPVNLDALPADLAAKVTAREKALGYTPPPLAPGYREDPTVDFMATPVAWVTAGLAVAPWPVIGYLGTSGIAGASPLLWPLALIITLGCWARKYRGPLALTRAEAKLVRQNTGHVSPSSLFHISRKEEALAAAAIEAIADIQQSRAWKSSHGDLHRIQLDLDEEAFQITESCQNLAKLDALIAAAEPEGRSNSVVRQGLVSAVSEYRSLYRQANTAVVSRIAALFLYRSELATIEALLDDIDKTSALMAGSSDFATAFTAIVRDEYAADRTSHLVDDLAVLKERLEAELAFISGQIINAPGLATPLIVRPGR